MSFRLSARFLSHPYICLNVRTKPNMVLTAPIKIQVIAECWSLRWFLTKIISFVKVSVGRWYAISSKKPMAVFKRPKIIQGRTGAPDPQESAKIRLAAMRHPTKQKDFLLGP